MKPEQDTPRLAFDLLPTRLNVVIVFALVTVSLVAWIYTVEQAGAMRSMPMGLGQLGHLQGQMGVVGFLVMWITMMTAMMLPTIVPLVLAHHAVALRRREGALSTLAFVSGYLLVWWAVGILMLLMYTVFLHWDDDGAARWLHLLAGEILIFAGAYQFSRLKQHCADMCRRPLTFVFQHDFHHDVRNALHAGTIHGAYCLGCCWAQMMVLVVVGLMNLLWMPILFVLFLVEKNWKHGRAVAGVAGIGLLVLGAAVLAHRPLLNVISN